MTEIVTEIEERDAQRALMIYINAGLIGGRCRVCDLDVRISDGPNQGGYLLRKMVDAVLELHTCIVIESWPPQAGDVWITKEDNGDVRLWSIIEVDTTGEIRALLAKGLDAGDNDRDPIGLARLNPRLVYRYQP